MSKRRRTARKREAQVLCDLLDLEPAYACTACRAEPALDLFPRVMILCRLCDGPVHLDCSWGGMLCPACAETRLIQCRCCGGRGVEKATAMERWCMCRCGKSLVHESCARTSLCPDCLPHHRDLWIESVRGWQVQGLRSVPHMSACTIKDILDYAQISATGLGPDCMATLGTYDGTRAVRDVWRQHPTKLPRLIVLRATEKPVPGSTSLFRVQWCTDAGASNEQVFILVVSRGAQWRLLPASPSVPAGTLALTAVMEVSCIFAAGEPSCEPRFPSRAAPASRA